MATTASVATASRRPSPGGLSRCAFLVAASGFGTDASRLVCASRAFAHGGASTESFLRGLLLCETRAALAGLSPARPRLVAASLVGDAARVRELVRAGADLRATDKRGRTCVIAAVSYQHVAVVRELLATAGVDGALVRARLPEGVATGHCAFSLACSWVANATLSGRALADAEACVRAMAASPLVAPQDLGERDGSALLWTCAARMPDVLASWLTDARCTSAVVARRDANGHSAYSIACFWAADVEHVLGAREHVAAAACVYTLTRSPLMGPESLGERNGTALLWACWARLPSVVSAWLADARCTRTVVLHRNERGHSAYSIACYWAADTNRQLSEPERAEAAVCVSLLAASQHIAPDDFQGTVLWWSCYARLPGVVSSWLTDPRCTSAIVARRDTNGDSPFSIACSWASDPDRKLSERERVNAASCACMLAASQLVAPDDLGLGNGTALYWACFARLPGVATMWLTDSRCTRAVAIHRSEHGHSPYSVACAWASDVEKLSEAERKGAVACVCALATSHHQGPDDLGNGDGTALWWTCWARLPSIVTSWLKDPRCTRAVVARRNNQGRSAFAIACYWAADAEHKLGERERGDAAACALALAHSLHVAPDDLVDASGHSALQWACRAHLSHLVAAWLALPSCTLAVTVARDGSGESPFSAACTSTRDADRHLSPLERAHAAACVRALTATLRPSPSDLGQFGGTALLWAAWAGLPDVVVALLAHPLCTRAVVTACDEAGESPFSAACKWAGDAERESTATERAAATQCAEALVASQHLHPGDTSHAGRTALHAACGAGLAGVVLVWLADPRCTKAVVEQRDREGRSAAHVLLRRLWAAEWLTPEERRDAAVCARALGGSPHLSVPLRAQLEAAAAAAMATATVAG